MNNKTNMTQKVKPSIQAADLPPALRVFWDTAPKQFKVPSILTALTCYCALGTRLRANYVYDLDPHALLIQLIVLGEPGSGKSFTRPIVKQLMRPLKLKDIEQKRIEQAYDEMKKTAAKNKALPEMPITTIRLLQTITKAKLLKRGDMFVRKYGDPLAFFFFSEELATMTESNKRAFADLNIMDRLAYDLGSEYSSDTLSDASYNADVDVVYCSVFCGTHNALNDYIDKRSVEGGNCTRKILSCIDGDIMGEDAPNFRRQTEEEALLVNNTVKQLMNETYTDDDLLQECHTIDMDWSFDEVKKWCKEQRKLVIKSGSRSLNCFYKRSSVSAWRLTCMCCHLWGENPEVQNHCKKFYRFMAQYILDGLMAKWGRLYEKLHKHDKDDGVGRLTLYDQLPEQFSRDQLCEYLVKLDLTTEARIFICKWKKARLIYQPDEKQDIYVKIY